MDWTEITNDVLKTEKCLTLITNDQLREIERIGFITGSRVLGGAIESSDYDYVLTEAEYDNLVKSVGLPKEDPIAYANYPSKSLKYTCDGKIINLIVTVSDIIKQGWVQTTNDYIKLVDISVPIHKSLRIAIFTHYRNINIPGAIEDCSCFFDVQD